MKFLLLLSLVVYSSSLLSLDMNESMSSQILKVYPKNVFVINRGLEDGVKVDEHIKLTSTDGFIARGLCIKTSLRYSLIKIYRVVRPELVSMDTHYTLHSIKQSEIAPHIKKLKAFDFTDDYKDFSEADLDLGKNLQQKRIANYDLPEIVDPRILKEVTDLEAAKKQNEEPIQQEETIELGE